VETRGRSGGMVCVGCPVYIDRHPRVEEEGRFTPAPPDSSSQDGDRGGERTWWRGGGGTVPRIPSWRRGWNLSQAWLRPTAPTHRLPDDDGSASSLPPPALPGGG